MNYSIIFAGGTGQRMKSVELPKQFLMVHGKPIIIHTIECFERCNEIDGMVVVCYEPYIEYMKKILKEFNITKVLDVVPGGDCGQKSIYNGLARLQTVANDDDIVLIHDGVRPIITDKLLCDCVDSVKNFGNAVTVSQAIETVITVKDDSVNSVLDRKTCYYAKAPQCFYYKDIMSYHKKAIEDNKFDFIDSASMATFNGAKLHIVVGDSKNLKITTPIDYFMYRAILDAEENNQLEIEND